MSKKNLVLVGMPGAGKSTIGSILSKKLDFELLDIDKIIEKDENSTIVNIFENKGSFIVENSENFEKSR